MLLVKSINMNGVSGQGYVEILKLLQLFCRFEIVWNKNKWSLEGKIIEAQKS